MHTSPRYLIPHAGTREGGTRVAEDGWMSGRVGVESTHVGRGRRIEVQANGTRAWIR